jgi:NDP-4-keto-2,6-dideoxyhexose 3-C-methyltransferase
MYREIERCRICGNAELVPLLSLGTQSLTGVFPRDRQTQVTSGPLDLVKCAEGRRPTCGLVQLRQSYSLDEMYGDNYGYGSRLNQSMVEHLHGKVRELLAMVELQPGDIVVDIGSNDGTLLRGYPEGPILVGFDPTGLKFKEHYPDRVTLFADFFAAGPFRREFDDRKAKIVTSIAMFYDLEDPIEFMREVMAILADDGVWLLEQSYMPAMLAANAYDTVCHEHLEYYGLRQVKWMADRVGLKIVAVEPNRVNGGSMAVTVAKARSAYPEDTAAVARILEAERQAGLDGLAPYEAFRERVLQHRERLRTLLWELRGRGQTVLGYGASTKGNVILQFCNLTEDDVPFIAEVNPDKFGCYTPGTGIPIISETEAKAKRPDAFLVLPWHFRDNLLRREWGFMAGGGRMLFPLPAIEAVGVNRDELYRVAYESP